MLVMLVAAEHFGTLAPPLLYQGLLVWLFKGGSKSVQVLFNSIETVMVVSLRILKKQTRFVVPDAALCRNGILWGLVPRIRFVQPSGSEEHK